MHSVATGTVGSQGRAVLCCQTMVAFKKGLHAVGRQIVLRIHSLGSVAVAAHFSGDLQWGTAFQCGDFVLGMAVRTSGSVPMPGCYRFSMYTFRHIISGLVMAPAACLCQARKMQGRLRRTRGQNGMAIM